MRLRVLSSIVLVASTLAPAQKPAAPGQRPASRQPSPKYDLAHEEKSKGVVAEVKESNCPVTGGTDTHLLVKMSDDKTVLVHLAPPRFLKEYGFNFAKDDQIEVLGSKVKIGEEEESLLARKIERGTDTFTFRDEGGKPLW